MLLSEIYAPISIEEDLEAKKRTRRADEPSGARKLESVQKVFYTGNKNSSRIFVKGEAGSGKSVFCLKLMESWSQLKQCPKEEHECEEESQFLKEAFEKMDRLAILETKVKCTTCDMQQYLSQFDLLYYVSLRDATERTESVVDLICDAVCNGCQDSIERTKRLISSQKIRSLVLLDGLDEWLPPPGFTGFPNIRGVNRSKCVLLSTMRPWKLAQLQLTPKLNDQIITVSGLSSYSVAKVIENVLVNFYGLEEDVLMTKFLECYERAENKTMQGLMKMPIMLIAACHLWQSENETFRFGQSLSRTHLYLALLSKMIASSAYKQKKSTTQGAPESGLRKNEEAEAHSTYPDILRRFCDITHVIDMLLPLCQLAYTDLVSDESKLVFHQGQLEQQLGQSEVDLAFKLGLISQRKLRGLCLRGNVKVNFYHKSVQELLAAMYLTCASTDKVTSFFEYCSSLDRIMQTTSFISFVMGLDSTLSCRFSEHIANVINNDPDITSYRQIFHYWRFDKVSLLYQGQCQWYREAQYNRKMTCDASPSPIIRVSDIYLDKYSDIDTVSMTADLIRSNPDSIVSVLMRHVKHPLHGVSQCLPLCKHLTVLNITIMENKNDNEQLVAIIPELTNLDTIWYEGVHFSCPSLLNDSSTRELPRVSVSLRSFNV